MKKLTLIIKFDDTDGYKGHGEDTSNIILGLLEREMKYSLEADGVIKKGWEISQSTLNDFILPLKQKMYNLLHEHEGMLVKDFKELPEVVELKTTIDTLEKFYSE